MTRMTVSAALRRIKKLKGLISERDARLKEAAVCLEGKEPAFPFAATFEERRKLVDEMIVLQTAVAKSNAVTLGAGTDKTIATVVRQLDEMKASIKMLKDFPFRTKPREEVVEESREWNDTLDKQVLVRKTLVWLSAMTQVARSEKVEALTDEFEALNNALEVSNHSAFVEIPDAVAAE